MVAKFNLRHVYKIIEPIQARLVLKFPKISKKGQKKLSKSITKMQNFVASSNSLKLFQIPVRECARTP